MCMYCPLLCVYLLCVCLFVHTRWVKGVYSLYSGSPLNESLRLNTVSYYTLMWFPLVPSVIYVCTACCCVCACICCNIVCVCVFVCLSFHTQQSYNAYEITQTCIVWYQLMHKYTYTNYTQHSNIYMHTNTYTRALGDHDRCIDIHTNTHIRALGDHDRCTHMLHK